MAGAPTAPMCLAQKECDICGRRFARNEHLTRHRRTHTNEKPFQCQHCHMSFPRADVKDKHLKRYHRLDETGAHNDGHLTKKLTSARQERSRQACDECRNRKLKCDNAHPCRSCHAKKLCCKVSSDRKGPGRPRSDTVISSSIAQPQEVSPHVSTDSTSPDGEAPPLEETPVPSILAPETSVALSSNGPGTDAAIERPSVSTNQIQHGQNAVPFHAADAAPPIADVDFFTDGEFVTQGWGELGIADGPWQMPMEVDPFIEGFGRVAYGTEWCLQDVPSMSTRANAHMDIAVAFMKEHFARRPRATSPTKLGSSYPWYSVSTRLQIYDEDIINVFLNLARNHLADSFSVFAYFEARAGTRQELCLAMAAVGGLFCLVDESTKIAQALYNDARRLLLANFHKDYHDNFDAAMAGAMTAILLEIYGMCSGDKRTYELAEAFHPVVLLKVRYCESLLLSYARPSIEHEHYRSLVVAAQVLEAYRVLFLHLPPTLFPYGTSTTDGDVDGEDALELKYCAYLMTPGTTSTRIVTKHIANVAMLCCYSWSFCPRGLESPAQNPLWKLDFIELAFDRWKWEREPETSRSSLPQVLLYYMAHISMHSNLAFLQLFAHNSAKSKRAISQHNLPAPIRKWAKEGHLKIANWHAESILALAANAVELSAQQPIGRPPGSRFFEPPHLAYCTYFACLITWYKSIYVSGDYRERDARAQLGAQLLLAMKLSVAKVLGEALCELLSDRSEACSG